MSFAEVHPSTGLPALDRILEGLLAGDNVVWQVGSIEDYLPFVRPYCETALRQGRKLIYFHFGHHDELIPPDPRVVMHRLDPAIGFETLTAEIHRVIARAGRGAFYLFDCLSDLAADWYSDMMLGNFFRVTCPYLRELDTIAYFALLRRRHSYRAVAAIRDTTQLLLDVHRHQGTLYVHPLKVYERYSPTMYLPHVWQGETFRPVTESAVISDIYEPLMREGSGRETDRFDLWDRTFQAAQQVLEGLRRGERTPEEAQERFRRLLRMVISRNERMLELAERYLTIEDLLAIRRRMIGAGLVGGKTTGMLVARAILRRAPGRWQEILEPHDSFFVGSDVFYSYLVNNGCWRMRQEQRDSARFLDNVERAQQQMLAGSFPEFVRDQFGEMLDYFGQAPIVVRSSSLLEDSFGNAFSGKYESVFCPNQGSPHERLEAFLAAVRHVYASAMGRDALLYRAQRDLLDRDEQMALLIQRVSGATYGRLFFPQVAGVGLSFNPFAWSEQIDPRAGVLRLVFGLGTRAVRRSDDDYTRIVALNAPARRPETTSGEVRGYAQWRVDVLDLERKQHCARSFEEVVESCGERSIEMVASRDPELIRQSKSNERPVFPWVLTFKKLLAETSFVGDMRELLATLEKAYDYPVDIEFTTNFLPDSGYRINLVQCRPFQVKGGGPIAPAPENVPAGNLVLATRGAIIGPSLTTTVGRLIYVVPAVYAQLPLTDRYSVARLIGRLTRLDQQPEGALLLAGPGRWGTAEPTLGVPVSFAEISRVTALCEIIEMRDGLVPDVSLGTHFFNDLVETQVLYLALVPGKEGNMVNADLIEQAPDQLPALIPSDAAWTKAVRVIDPASLPGRRALHLHADAVRQSAVCYFHPC
ncbi:MAG: PEP/pyruvate-binding domain-containing protein [Acidobacteria bacterium]|nr:PEP/pyruvate-binding domain-containing protein [Acidobacteriota bacterium]